MDILKEVTVAGESLWDVSMWVPVLQGYLYSEGQLKYCNFEVKNMQIVADVEFKNQPGVL